MNVPVTFKNLVELDDGRLAAAFDREIRAAHADLRDRPADKRKRKITLKVVECIFTGDGTSFPAKSQWTSR